MAKRTTRISSKRKSVKLAKRVSAKRPARLARNQRSWSAELRRAVLADGRSIYAISLAALGTTDKQAQLARFLRGGGITLDSAEQLGRALGFRLVRS